MTAELQKIAAGLAVIADTERAQIEAATARIRARMNGRRERLVVKTAADLPAMSWSWHADESTIHARGQAGAGYYESEVPGVVKAWADALGLEIQTTGVVPDLGLVSATGEADGIRVTVWGIVDRKRWEEEMRPRREQARPEPGPDRHPSRTES